MLALVAEEGITTGFHNQLCFSQAWDPEHFLCEDLTVWF
jgi:hypothetical protein